MSKKIVNKSESTQFVSGMKAFAAKEVRDVSDDTATILLANPNFALFDSGTNLEAAGEETQTFGVKKTRAKK